MSYNILVELINVLIHWNLIFTNGLLNQVQRTVYLFIILVVVLRS